MNLCFSPTLWNNIIKYEILIIRELFYLIFNLVNINCSIWINNRFFITTIKFNFNCKVIYIVISSLNWELDLLIRIINNCYKLRFFQNFSYVERVSIFIYYIFILYKCPLFKDNIINSVNNLHWELVKICTIHYGCWGYFNFKSVTPEAGEFTEYLEVIVNIHWEESQIGWLSWTGKLGLSWSIIQIKLKSLTLELLVFLESHNILWEVVNKLVLNKWTNMSSYIWILGTKYFFKLLLILNKYWCIYWPLSL